MVMEAQEDAIENPIVNIETPANEKDNDPESDTSDQSKQYIRGWRLYTITACLCMCLFLTNLEIPIVTTALVGITTDLGGFDRANWITSAYLLGYVAVLIIYAKLSDIFGRKSFLLIAVFIFTVFSAACGAAQTIKQLIVFRAFQGIGGAGNYSLCSVMFLELVPTEKYAKYTSAISVVYTFSLLLGPIFGGAISQSATWRWVFLLNVPPAALTGAVIIFALPNRFPNHANSAPTRTRFSVRRYFDETIRRVDFGGCILLLVATLFLVAALEEANTQYPWKSGFVISLLVISGIAWSLFLVWERRVTLKMKRQEPVFPWRFAQNRVWLGMLLNSIFLGGTWFVTMFQLPQEYQIVKGLSPLQAGVRFIPFTLAAPLGSVVAPTIGKVFKVPLVYLVLVASIIQVIGYALFTTLPASSTIQAAQYGYQIIAGFGCGINITLLILMTPYAVEDRDKAVAMGTVAQFRVMGGVICLAIATTVFNSYIRSNLGAYLTPDQISAVLESVQTISTFPPETQDMVRAVFSKGYSLQMDILAGCAGAQVLGSFLMWKKKQIIV